MTEIKIHFQLSFQDYLSAQRLHAKYGFWPRASYFLGWWFNPVLGLCLIGESFFLARAHANRLSVLVVFFAGATLSGWRFYMRRRWKMYFQKTRKGTAETELAFNEDRIFAEVSDFAKSEYSWSAVTLWREDHDVLSIYVAPAIFIAIPKRAISETQLNELRALLMRKTVPR